MGNNQAKYPEPARAGDLYASGVHPGGMAQAQAAHRTSSGESAATAAAPTASDVAIEQHQAPLGVPNGPPPPATAAGHGVSVTGAPQPEHTDFFLSHTQRNGTATTLATELYSSLKEQGQSVWFDVKMADRSSAAMKKGVENAQCVIAIITGPCDNPDCPDDLPASNAYFARPYCVSELRWAKEAGVKIQPVIRASDKSKIAELMSLAPDDLQFLCDIDFITLDRSDNDYWAVGIKKLMRGIGKAAVDPSAPPPPAAVPAPVGYPAPAPAFGVPGQPMAAPMAAPYGAYPAQPAYGVPQQPVYGQTVAMAPTVTPYTAVVQTPYMGPPASQFPQHHHHHHGGHHHHSGLSHPIHQIHRHSGHHHSGLNHPIHQIHNRHRHGGHHHNHHNHHHGGSHFDIGVSFGGDSSFGNDDSFGDDMSFGD